jgi:hypothetical protein
MQMNEAVNVVMPRHPSIVGPLVLGTHQVK